MKPLPIPISRFTPIKFLLKVLQLVSIVPVLFVVETILMPLNSLVTLIEKSVD